MGDGYIRVGEGAQSRMRPERQCAEEEGLTEYEVVVRMCRSSGMAMTGGSAVTPRAMTSATVSWLVMLLMLELVMGSERKGTQESCR